MSIARPPLRRSSGVVLIVVLLGLALMMILLLALFAGTLQQSHGAASGELLGREKMLADSAVALVIGQIGQASTQSGQAWISQPGLLRTYAADATRKPTACYKLYSTAKLTDMIDKTGTLAFMATDVPSRLEFAPRRLHRPECVGPGDLSDSRSGGCRQRCPVSAPTQWIRAWTMPVAWLYQLQDGTLGPASNGTAANPIVARIAFWTDDETCKININTAGCGSPWNTPRVNSPDDIAWSTNAARRRGIPRLSRPSCDDFAGRGVSGDQFYSPQQLLGLTPRYAWGGSQFGTQTTTPGESVPLKMDRLYASIDELCFSSSLTSAGQRAANPVTPGSTRYRAICPHRPQRGARNHAARRTARRHLAGGRFKLGKHAAHHRDRSRHHDRRHGRHRHGKHASNYFFQRNDPLNPYGRF